MRTCFLADEARDIGDFSEFATLSTDFLGAASTDLRANAGVFGLISVLAVGLVTIGWSFSALTKVAVFVVF